MTYTESREVTELRRVSDFDHPFTVHPDGTVTDAPAGVYAPEVYHVDGAQPPHDVEIHGAGWEAWSTGYTGQHGYRGAVMHASEFLGGRMARDLLESPGVYVVTAVEVHPDEYCLHCAEPVRELGDGEHRSGFTGWAHVGGGARCSDTGDTYAEPDSTPEPAGWIVLRLVSESDTTDIP